MGVLIDAQVTSATASPVQPLGIVIGRNASTLPENQFEAASRQQLLRRTRRPLIKSQAASAVRAKAMPWPSIAASISMLARFRTGPEPTVAFTPAASNRRVQF